MASRSCCTFLTSAGAYRQNCRKSQAGQIDRSSTGRKSPLRIPSTHSSSRVPKGVALAVVVSEDMPPILVYPEVKTVSVIFTAKKVEELRNELLPQQTSEESAA